MMKYARSLRHPVAPGLGAAGLAAGDPAPAATTTAGPAATARADVPASVALTLLALAGVTAGADVHEVPRVPAPGSSATEDARVLGRGLADVDLLVAVGSLSARHGPDAPVADDPRAPDVDEHLLAALAAGPLGLARALGGLGTAGARELAVSGWSPWHAVLGLLGALPDPAGVRVAACTGAVVAGAQHAVAAWLPDPGGEPRPAAPEPGAHRLPRPRAAADAEHDPARETAHDPEEPR